MSLDISIAKQFEGLRLKAYDDLQPNVDISDPNIRIKGTLTIGYGHTGKDVKRNSVITEADAERLLREDMAEAVARAKNLVPNWQKLNNNQFSAVVDFVFNCGGTYVDKLGKRQKYILLHIIDANPADVAIPALFVQTAVTSKGVPLRGLVARREAEAKLYAK